MGQSGRSFLMPSRIIRMDSPGRNVDVDDDRLGIVAHKKREAIGVMDRRFDVYLYKVLRHIADTMYAS
jgi:hypothetical protein